MHFKIYNEGENVTFQRNLSLFNATCLVCVCAGSTLRKWATSSIAASCSRRFVTMTPSYPSLRRRSSGRWRRLTEILGSGRWHKIAKKKKKSSFGGEKKKWDRKKTFRGKGGGGLDRNSAVRKRTNEKKVERMDGAKCYRKGDCVTW